MAQFEIKDEELSPLAGKVVVVTGRRMRRLYVNRVSVTHELTLCRRLEWYRFSHHRTPPRSRSVGSKWRSEPTHPRARQAGLRQDRRHSVEGIGVAIQAWVSYFYPQCVERTLSID